MKHFLLLLALIYNANLSAQINLIYNSSFEIHTNCPFGQGQLSFSSGWIDPSSNGSEAPEYYNLCATHPLLSVPLNIVGYQAAHSLNSYVGFVSYVDIYGNNTPGNKRLREYVETELIDTLIRKKKYSVEFYISLADSSTYTCSSIGAYFSDTLILTTSDSALPFTPQILNPAGNYLLDKINWTKISGTFIANGGEKFITIGTFADRATIDTLPTGLTNPYRAMAYYYIDDVSVTLWDSTIAVNDLETSNKIKLYPNPTQTNFTVRVDLPSNKNKMSIELYDVLGCLQRKEILYSGTNSINTEQWSNGVYLFKIISSGINIKQGKLVLAK